MRSRLRRVLQAIGSALSCAAALCAQAIAPSMPAAPPQATPPGYTLHVATRLVLTDVTVTDKHNDPVHGLARAAFSIFDNGKSQGIASFAEHTGGETPERVPTPSPGEFNNAYLQHPPPAFNVLLLDTTTIAIDDQMFLADQLNKFIAILPPGNLLAVYTRAGDAVVPLQAFTADHALLRSALYKAIPHLRQPGSWAASDLDTLQQMVRLLRPYPGRKNLIWFTGGSNLALLPDASQLSAFVNMRPVYDELESSRIAVFPIDARGLTVAEPGGMISQQMMMEETAQATGGHAFYNNNGLKQIAAHIVDTGSDFYTLSYYPHEGKFDGKWHKVSVAVDVAGEKYQLSYRRGYFDDGSSPPPDSGVRTVLRADGSTRDIRPDALKTPILFSATVLPEVPIPPTPEAVTRTTVIATPLRRNKTAYTVHFTLPAAEFTQQPGNGQPRVLIGTGVLAVNRFGTRLARQVETVTIGIDPDKIVAHPKGVIGFDERINLPKGQEFLYIVVWDKDSGRFGTIQAPLEVPKPSK